MKRLIQAYPVAAFITFTLFYSWTLWLLMILSEKGILPFRFPVNFSGSFGPAFGALMVSGIIGGKSGLINILRSLFKWKTSLFSYLLALFFIVGVYIITAGITGLADASVIKFQKLRGTGELIIYFFVIAIAGGPLGEEIGWRGFLQKELMKRYNPALTSLYIAAIWLIWHIPLFWLEGAAQKGESVFYFAISVLAMAFMFTLLYIKSNGSLLLAILFHTMINYVSAYLMPAILPSSETSKSFGHISAFVLSGISLIFFLIFFRTFIYYSAGSQKQNNIQPS